MLGSIDVFHILDEDGKDTQSLWEEIWSDATPGGNITNYFPYHCFFYGWK